MADTSPNLEVKKEKPPETRTDVWHPFESLRREVDRLFDDFGGGWPRLLPRRTPFDVEGSWSRAMPWGAVPAVDIVEKDKQFEVTAELPGLDEKDIDVSVANGMLTIKGEKTEEKEEKEKDRYLSERRYGSFERRFRLPEGVDADRIEASFRKGVLIVTLPKSAEGQKQQKKIAVKGG
jgi:HSP20 family protein